MNNTTKILNDLVSVTHDGKSFYEHAANNVGDPELKALFTRMASVKDQIVTGLSSEIKALGEKPSETGTWAGDMSKLYGDLRAMVGDKKYAYVAQLEDSEDRLLKAFDEAIRDKDTPVSVRDVLNRFLPEVRNCHDIMRSRKLALKKAA
jgi:uncharacterized protein (TIGR02284 family)